MKDVIHKLRDMISSEMRIDMTGKQEHYVSGLSDALEIVEDYARRELVPGNKYYVIMYRDNDKFLPYIKEMKLYKITSTRTKTAYCFTNNLNYDYRRNNAPTPDLILYSKFRISKRVFITEEEAENAIKNV